MILVVVVLANRRDKNSALPECQENKAQTPLALNKCNVMIFMFTPIVHKGDTEMELN